MSLISENLLDKDAGQPVKLSWQMMLGPPVVAWLVAIRGVAESSGWGWLGLAAGSTILWIVAAAWVLADDARARGER
jgi:hypothetical protein